MEYCPLDMAFQTEARPSKKTAKHTIPKFTSPSGETSHFGERTRQDEVIPALQKPIKSLSLPDHFISGSDAEPAASSEGFQTFTNIIGDDPGYRLSPDFGTIFEASGLGKASGESLAIPSIRSLWKPLTPTGANTAFYDALLPSIGEGVRKEEMPKEDYLKRLDFIYARLDDLETRRSENVQTEVLMFVMSGLFIMFSMDILVRMR